jgi:hypothetical protein
MDWQIAIKYKNGKIVIKNYANMRTAFVASDKYIKNSEVLEVIPSPSN